MKKFKIRETGVILQDLGAEDYISPTGWNICKVGIKELGLHLDPVVDEPRKLYAYKDEETNKIIFMTFANSLSTNRAKRAPEYDILYPLDGKDGE